MERHVQHMLPTTIYRLLHDLLDTLVGNCWMLVVVCGEITWSYIAAVATHLVVSSGCLHGSQEI